MTTTQLEGMLRGESGHIHLIAEVSKRVEGIVEYPLVFAELRAQERDDLPPAVILEELADWA